MERSCSSPPWSATDGDGVELCASTHTRRALHPSAPSTPRYSFPMGGGSVTAVLRRLRSRWIRQPEPYEIVGGGNEAGYAARTFVKHGMADGRLCIVSKEAHPSTSLDKRLSFPSRQEACTSTYRAFIPVLDQDDLYRKPFNLFKVLYEDPVVTFDGKTQTLKTSSGKILKYGSLIISIGCEASRLPAKTGGNLPGVHYIRDVADAEDWQIKQIVI
ncbi:hypothetical protein ABZP36_012034 [Zizania latifolia]